MYHFQTNVNRSVPNDTKQRSSKTVVKPWVEKDRRTRTTAIQNYYKINEYIETA